MFLQVVFLLLPDNVCCARLLLLRNCGSRRSSHQSTLMSRVMFVILSEILGRDHAGMVLTARPAAF